MYCMALNIPVCSWPWNETFHAPATIHILECETYAIETD